MTVSAILAVALASCALPIVSATFNWDTVLNQNSLQSGDVTSYGSGQDKQGACSYGANFANTVDLPWKTGVPHTLALNSDQFGGGLACGLCVLYKGTGTGIGTVPIPTEDWQFGLVTNICPECAHGALDIANDGNGRWGGEWFAVPCNVGSSKMTYSIVVSSYYWFSMVVSNTRIPIANVSAKIGDNWIGLTRGSNNQWAYYNSAGPWEDNFPMGLRITSVTGEVVEDAVPSKTGGDGTVQFKDVAPFKGLSSAVTSMATIPPNTGLTGGTPAATTSGKSTSTTTAPPAAATPSPSTTSPASADSTYPIENDYQCGGTAGVCGESGSPCVAGPWPRARCSKGYTCSPLSGGTKFYSCQMEAESAPTPSPAANISSPPPIKASPSPTVTLLTPEGVAAAPSQPKASPSPAAATPSPAEKSTAPAELSPSPIPSTTSTNASAAAAAAAHARATGSPSPSPLSAASPAPALSPSPVTFSASPSPASTHPPSLAASKSPSPTSSPPPTSDDDSPSSPASTSSSPGSFGIGLGNQCGGSGSNCGQTDTPCTDSPWPKAYCQAGSCTRQYAQLWLCSSGGAVVPHHLVAGDYSMLTTE